MKRTPLGLSLSLILMAVIATACGSQPAGATGEDPLGGTSWVLFAYRKTSPIPGTEITATFEGGQVTGSAGCNSYFGSYEARGGTISIGPVAQTEMACIEPEGVMDQEQEYLKYLSSAHTYRFEDGRMLVYWTEHEALTFEPR